MAYSYNTVDNEKEGSSAARHTVRFHQLKFWNRHNQSMVIEARTVVSSAGVTGRGHTGRPSGGPVMLLTGSVHPMETHRDVHLPVHFCVCILYLNVRI